MEKKVCDYEKGIENMNFIWMWPTHRSQSDL